MTTNPLSPDELVLKVAREVERVFYEAVDRGDMRGPQAFEHVARAAIAAMPELTVQGWQPIETAPKDGTWIMICGGAPGYGWDGDDRDGRFTPPAVVAQFLIHAQRWQFAWYYGEWSDPTHWMPLPEPPVESSNG